MDQRVGTRDANGTQWPTLDVLGQPYSRAAASEYGIGPEQFVMVSTGTPPRLIAPAIDAVRAALSKATPEAAPATLAEGNKPRRRRAVEQVIEPESPAGEPETPHETGATENEPDGNTL